MIALACPHCGGKLWVQLETVGHGHLTHEVPGSIECVGDCEAVWEPDGAPRDAPKIRYPDLYKAP
jgi:hypothetical protein